MLSFYKVGSIFFFRFPLLSGKIRTMKTDCEDTAKTIFAMFKDLKDLTK